MAFDAPFIVSEGTQASTLFALERRPRVALVLQPVGGAPRNVKQRRRDLLELLQRGEVGVGIGVNIERSAVRRRLAGDLYRVEKPRQLGTEGALDVMGVHSQVPPTPCIDNDRQ